MLSRTADNLYWLARYMERAETAARLLEVGARIALMPSAAGLSQRMGQPAAPPGRIGPLKKYGDPVQRNIESHLFFDRDNPSSVASCITRARENGRIVRTALTTQVWDALNTAFQELRAGAHAARPAPVAPDRMDDAPCRMVRGAIDATLLRNDGWDFLNLGYYLERADNTARLLDVKYYVLLPRGDFVGSGLDNYQWTTLLRAMSAHRAFHWAYGGEVTAAKIAHFLILNPQCPRSLITCVGGLTNHLDRLAKRLWPQTDGASGARAMLGGLADHGRGHLSTKGCTNS
jgi:uncharacterized alpha-E superfamily protein